MQFVVHNVAGVVMFGGGEVCAYLPDTGIQETLRENGEEAVWKIRYFFYQINP